MQFITSARDDETIWRVQTQTSSTDVTEDVLEIDPIADGASEAHLFVVPNYFDAKIVPGRRTFCRRWRNAIMKNVIPVTGWDSSNGFIKKVQRSSFGHNLTPVGEEPWKHSNIVITLK